MSLIPNALLNPKREELLSRQEARTYLIVNLVGCPGIGTVMAGRRIGWAQVFLVLAGVCLMLAFAAIYFRAVMQVATDIFSSEGDFWSTVRRNAWLGIAGFIATASAWIWSLITGLSILHNAKERERKPPPIPC